MTADVSHEVTRLLHDWQGGDRAALEKLAPLVYDELRRLASHYLRGERRDHTLQGTALVHEAFSGRGCWRSDSINDVAPP